MAQTELTLALPDAAVISAALLPLVQAAAAMIVSNEVEHGAALHTIAELRRREKRITEHFEPTRAALEKAKKANLAARDSLISPMEEARRILGGKCDLYEEKARRLAEAESRRLAEIARKTEEERQLQDAIMAEAAGSPELADEILAEPTPQPVVAVAPAVAQVEGVGSRQAWHGEIEDPGAFIRWLAAHPEETAMTARAAEACGPEVNSRARSQREAMQIPGWRAVAETIRSVRG